MRLEDRHQPPAEERNVEHDERHEDPRVEQAADHSRAVERHDERAEHDDEQDRHGEQRGEGPLAVVGLADAGKEEGEERSRR